VAAVPDSYFGYLHRGKDYYSVQAAAESQREDDEKSLAHWEEMAGHHEEAKKHYQESEQHRQEKRRLWELAADDFKAALEINPRYDFGNNNLGVYYAGVDKMDLAEAYFKQALEAKPAYSDALGNLCSIYMREGRFAEAVSYGEAAIRLQPGKATYHLNLALAYEGLRKVQEAAIEFQRAILCNRSLPLPYAKLGMLYAKMGNLEEAEKYLKAVTDILPQDPEAARNLDLVRKIGQLQQEVKAGRGTADIYGGLGELSMYFRNWNEAEKYLQKMLQIDPQNLRARQALEQVRAMRKKAERH
jgi:tetratricopeptide (TPR) repeat protein